MRKTGQFTLFLFPVNYKLVSANGYQGIDFQFLVKNVQINSENDSIVWDIKQSYNCGHLKVLNKTSHNMQMPQAFHKIFQLKQWVSMYVQHMTI